MQTCITMVTKLVDLLLSWRSFVLTYLHGTSLECRIQGPSSLNYLYIRACRYAAQLQQSCKACRQTQRSLSQIYALPAVCLMSSFSGTGSHVIQTPKNPSCGYQISTQYHAKHQCCSRPLTLLIHMPRTARSLSQTGCTRRSHAGFAVFFFFFFTTCVNLQLKLRSQMQDKRWHSYADDRAAVCFSSRSTNTSSRLLIYRQMLYLCAICRVEQSCLGCSLPIGYSLRWLLLFLLLLAIFCWRCLTCIR